MSLIVESGTGADNSESYASVAYALNYHANLGNDAWALLSTAKQEQSLRKATNYIEQVYCDSWQGLQVNGTQALKFPRSGIIVNGYSVSSSTVPIALQNATCELALKASTDELSPDLERGTLREKVGVLEVEYDKYSPQSKRYIAVDNMLRPFATNNSGITAALLRA